MNKWRLITGLAIALSAILIFALPVFAIDLPDSPPTVESIRVYHNLLEAGDILIVIYENTPYSTTPDMNYSDSFIWRLIGTDNVTEIAEAVGYDYDELGYGYNVISFYFSAAEAPTWLQEYTLRLSGTPAAFIVPPEYNYPMSVTDYTSENATLDVQLELYYHIIETAQDLDNKWGLLASDSLLLEIETGTVLSIYGESFFRGSIYGIQALCPQLFRVALGTANVTDRTWTEAYSANLSTQYAGTWPGNALDAGEDFWDVNYNLMGIIFTILACIGLYIANIYLGASTWEAFLEPVVVLIICSRIGMYGLGELALLAAICWLYLSAKIWKVV